MKAFMIAATASIVGIMCVLVGYAAEIRDLKREIESRHIVYQIYTSGSEPRTITFPGGYSVYIVGGPLSIKWSEDGE